VVVRDAYDAITVQDLDGRTIAWNPGAVRMYGWSEAEALTLNVRERIPPDMQKEALERVHQLAKAATLESYQTVRLNKEGTRMSITLTSTALVNEFGRTYAIATTERLGPGHDAA
jgi:two-component system CheB/CheR fusion protein